MLVTNPRGALCHVSSSLAGMLGVSPKVLMANGAAHALSSLMTEPYATMHRTLAQVGGAGGRACVCGGQARKALFAENSGFGDFWVLGLTVGGDKPGQPCLCSPSPHFPSECAVHPRISASCVELPLRCHATLHPSTPNP